eukprot:COSAG01_NODE_2474_length_7623_cov_9.861111_6_plen_63_part_00
MVATFHKGIPDRCVVIPGWYVDRKSGLAKICLHFFLRLPCGRDAPPTHGVHRCSCGGWGVLV